MPEVEASKETEAVIKEVTAVQVNGTTYQVADIKHATMGMFADLEEEFDVKPKDLKDIGFRYQLKMAFMGLNRLDKNITMLQVRDLEPEDIAAIFVRMNRRRANENL